MAESFTFPKIDLPDGEEALFDEASFKQIESLLATMNNIEQLFSQDLWTYIKKQDIWELLDYVVSTDLAPIFKSISESIDSVLSNIDQRWENIFIFLKSVRSAITVLESPSLSDLQKAIFIYSKITEIYEFLNDFYKNPAEAFKFAFNSLATRFIEKPVTIGGVSFKLSKIPSSDSQLFGNDVFYDIEVQYDNDFFVKFKNLYFVLIEQVPTVRFDKIKIDENSLFSSILKPMDTGFSIGDDFSIDITDVKFEDDEIKVLFSMQVRIIPSLPYFKVEGVKLGSSSFLELPSKVTLNVESDVGIPIATTGFSYYGYSGSLDIDKKSLSISTKISLASPPKIKDTFHLDATVTFQFLNVSLELNGEITLANTFDLAHFGAKLSIIPTLEINGFFEIPPKNNSLIANIINSKGDFQLNIDGCFADVEFVLLKSLREKASLYIDYSGNLEYFSTKNINFLTIFKSSAIFRLTAKDQFTRANGSIEGTLKLKLISYMGYSMLSISATFKLEVDYKYPRETSVSFKLESGPIKLEMSLKSLDEKAIINSIKDELNDVAGNFLDKLKELGKLLDEGFRDLLGEIESKAMLFVLAQFKASGLDDVIDANPTLKRVASKIEDEGKKAKENLNRIGADISDAWKELLDNFGSKTIPLPSWFPLWSGPNAPQDANSDPFLDPGNLKYLRAFFDPLLEDLENVRFEYNHFSRSHLFDSDIESGNINFRFATCGYVGEGEDLHGQIRVMIESSFQKSQDGVLQLNKSGMMNAKIILRKVHEKIKYSIELSEDHPQLNIDIKGIIDGMVGDLFDSTNTPISPYQERVRRTGRLAFVNKSQESAIVLVRTFTVGGVASGVESIVLEPNDKKLVEFDKIVYALFTISMPRSGRKDHSHARRNFWIHDTEKKYNYERLGSGYREYVIR